MLSRSPGATDGQREIGQLSDFTRVLSSRKHPHNWQRLIPNVCTWWRHVEHDSRRSSASWSRLELKTRAARL
jgi:hypothetical protein